MEWRNFASERAFGLRNLVRPSKSKRAMHEIIYLIGLVVVVMFILGLLGLR
jgi:hypothetical protein